MAVYREGDFHWVGDPIENITALKESPTPDYLGYLVQARNGKWCWEDTLERGQDKERGDFDLFEQARKVGPTRMSVAAVRPRSFNVGDRVKGLGVNSRNERVGTYQGLEGGVVVIQVEDGGTRCLDPTTVALVAEPDKTEEVTVRARVLDEAKRITATDRNSAYGEPEDNFQRIADYWNVWLQDKLKEGEEITQGDTAAMQIFVKMAREMNAPKEDNKIDLAGYAACWAEVDAR